MTPRVIRVHFNRIAMQRGDPRVWSIQMSDRCYHARGVMMDVPMRTEYKPEKRDNPRAFFQCYGYLRFNRQSEVATISREP